MVQRARLAGTDLEFYPLSELTSAGFDDPSGLPMTVKILLEGLVRLAESGTTAESNVGVLYDAAPVFQNDRHRPLP